MVFLKPYTSIKNFLSRYTIIKIGNFHVRIHRILDKDQTTLFHNHPFNYISIILKGGYTETYIDNGIKKSKTHGFLSVIKRNHNVFHRIDKINFVTITLFITFGKYKWRAYNTIDQNETNGVYLRIINDKELWSKKENGIWFIGHLDKNKALKEIRHSIHQI